METKKDREDAEAMHDQSHALAKGVVKDAKGTFVMTKQQLFWHVREAFRRGWLAKKERDL